jgi:hypothetical protein
METNEQITEAFTSLKQKVNDTLTNESALVSLAVLCELAEVIAVHLGDETRGCGVDMVRVLYNNATQKRCNCGKVMGPRL